MLSRDMNICKCLKLYCKIQFLNVSQLISHAGRCETKSGISFIFTDRNLAVEPFQLDDETEFSNRSKISTNNLKTNTSFATEIRTGSTSYKNRLLYNQEMKNYKNLT